MCIQCVIYCLASTEFVYTQIRKWENPKPYNKKENLSRSDYLRKLANNFESSSPNIEYITKYNEDFKMLGNIFHKLARQANFYGYIDDKTYKKYVTYLFEILDDIKSNLNIK